MSAARRSARKNTSLKNPSNDAVLVVLQDRVPVMIAVGDCVEVNCNVKGQDDPVPSYGRVVDILHNEPDDIHNAKIIWFYSKQELVELMGSKHAPFLSHLEPHNDEVYLSTHSELVSFACIARGARPFPCLCLACADARKPLPVRKRKETTRSHMYFYRAALDMAGGITSGQCESCGEPSFCYEDKENAITPAVSTNTTRSRNMPKSAAKPASESGDLLQHPRLCASALPRTRPIRKFASLIKNADNMTNDDTQCTDIPSTLSAVKTPSSKRRKVCTEKDILASLAEEKTPMKWLRGTRRSSACRKLNLDDSDTEDPIFNIKEHIANEDPFEFKSDSEIEEDFASPPLRQRTTTPSRQRTRERGKQSRLNTPKPALACTPGRTSSKKKTSPLTLAKRTYGSRKKDLTISLPKRSLPESVGLNDYRLAQERLHVSAVPSSLPCREQQFAQIFSFVEKKLKQQSGGCLYISGVPGTGKTATVHEVMCSLKEAEEEGLVPQFKFVEINGMRMTDPYQTYPLIWKQLKGERVSADNATSLLDKYFSRRQQRDKSRPTVVLLADELDLLWTRKQTILYNLFDWPSRDNAGLIVLAVANTMDLPERIMMNRVSSRLGLTRLTFQPYTFKQLQEIVCSRLEGLLVFEQDAIELASRKVAAVSGDARRALNICRRASELSESRQGGSGLVGLKDIEAAVTEMFTSPKIRAMMMASLMEKLFLKAVVAEFRRSGLEEATFEAIYKQLLAVCLIEGLCPPCMSVATEVCHRLFTVRLILVEATRLDLFRRVRLNVSVEDVIFALQQ